jgi:hypothetical protein
VKIPSVTLIALVLSTVTFAEVVAMPGATLVKPVFDASDLVCYCFVETVSITRGDVTKDSYGNTFVPDTMRATVRIEGAYKETTGRMRKAVIQNVHKSSLGGQPFSILQRGQAYLFFLKISSPGVYELTDSHISATPFKTVLRPVGGAGLAELESALRAMILNPSPVDRVTALRLLQGFDHLDQRTLSVVDRLCDSKDPDVAFTALAILIKTKSPESVARLLNHLVKNKTEPQTFAVVSIGPELAQIRDKRALSSIEALTDSRFISIRDGAMQSLRAMGNPESAPTLVRKLNDPDVSVQYQAVITLAEIFDKKTEQFAPTIPTFNQSPRKYIDAWQKWWTDEGQDFVHSKNPARLLQN